MGTQNNPMEDEEIYVDLNIDGKEITCSIVTIFTVGEKDYIALLPLNEDGENEDGNVWLYGYKEDPDNPETDPEIIYIEDEEEYEAAADAFDEYLDSQEFDELIDGEDEE